MPTFRTIKTRKNRSGLLIVEITRMIASINMFKALPWRKQNDTLEPYVMASLRVLKEPIETKRLMLDVAYRIGWLDLYGEYLPGAARAIGNVLKRFTVHKPGLAVHDGETFYMVGREMRRWMWQPQPPEPADDVSAFW